MEVQGRLTLYQKSVLEVLRSTHHHPTAAEVFRIVQRRHPGVAFATIYNSLNRLERSGIIGRVNFTEGAFRYDPIIERHDHLVCSRCGALRDVKVKLPKQLWSHAGRREGFRVEHYRVELFGLCRRCAAASADGAKLSVLT